MRLTIMLSPYSIRIPFECWGIFLGKFVKELFIDQSVLLQNNLTFDHLYGRTFIL
jgi:hypothetical protein